MNINESWLFSKPIAHRGLHNEEFPENTLLAFNNAIKHGYPIELDVRTIDDGTLVVFHDDKLCRMTGEDGYISNIVKTDLNTMHIAKTAETIPTFEDVLELVNGQVPILIETKNTNKVGELEKRLNDVLKAYTGEFALQSFNPYSMEYFKIHSPDFLRGQLSCVFPKSELTFIKRYMLSHLKMNKVSDPNFISYNHTDLPSKYVTKTNLPILTWTIRSNSEYNTVKPYCNNIIFEKFIPTLASK